MSGTVDRVPPWTLAVSAMLLIQLSNALSVPVIAHVGPAGTAWLKLCFGGAVLLAVVRPNLCAIQRSDLPALLGLGLATGFMSVFLLAAIERIPLGTAVAIDFLGPLIVAGFSSKRRSALVWPALALVGVVLLTEPWHTSTDFIGIGFALLAGASWGLYNVLTQSVGDRYSGITGLAITIPVAAVFTSAIGLPQVITGDPTWEILLLTAGIALLAPVISFALEMLALRRMTQTAFGTLLAIEPAFGVLIGLVVLDQHLTGMRLIGVALVVLAAAAAQRGGRRQPQAASGTETSTTAQ